MKKGSDSIKKVKPRQHKKKSNHVLKKKSIFVFSAINNKKKNNKWKKKLLLLTNLVNHYSRILYSFFNGIYLCEYII